MQWIKAEFLSEGKGKSIYRVKDHPHLIWMEFKDNLTAFNGKKQSHFKGKGALNRDTSSFVFRFLKKEGIKTHWLKNIGKAGMICSSLQIIPLEVVVRNRLAGSTARKFQFPEGKALSKPLVEFYYKNDTLGDPFLSLDQAVLFNFIANKESADLLKKQALQVNQKLKKLFDSVGLDLIDFKLEFGTLKKQALESPNQQGPLPLTASSLKAKPLDFFILADEISCDSCRLWDKSTGKRMDKDRFRLDLGEVESAYKTVCDLLRKNIDQS